VAGFQLPPKRVYNSEFSQRGREDVVMIEALPIRDGERLVLVFESVHSPWRQGVWMMTRGHLVINEQASPGMDVWQDTAPVEVPIECRTDSGVLLLYNIYERNGQRNSQAWTSGMLIEDIPNGRRYRCNDFGLETDFDKLVFRIERQPDAVESR
jgi:hypothetical protein